MTSWASPGAGITRDYNGDSDSLRIFVIFFCGLALYNAAELLIMIFMTFKRYQGAYFWSMLTATAGIIPYSIGFMLRFLVITSGPLSWLPIALLTVGWWAMVTGQSFVLWSRLHLIMTGRTGEKVITYTKWLIITNIFILHVPTTVLTWGSNGGVDRNTFQYAYNIMEKIQMSGFALTETFLSSLYIVATSRILRTSLQPATRTVMKQLVVINVIIILMDLALLGLEYASLYILETLLKGFVYSLKAKLEIVILSKLVKFVGGNKPGNDVRKLSVGFITTHRMSHEHDEMASMDIRDFVNLERVATNITHPSRSHRDPEFALSHRHKTYRFPETSLYHDLARFEHVEDVASLHAASSRNSSPGGRKDGRTQSDSSSATRLVPYGEAPA